MIFVCQPISSILNFNVGGAVVGATWFGPALRSEKRCGSGFGGVAVSVTRPAGSSAKMGWFVAWKPSQIACFRRSRFGTPAFGQFL